VIPEDDTLLKRFLTSYTERQGGHTRDTKNLMKERGELAAETEEEPPRHGASFLFVKLLTEARFTPDRVRHVFSSGT
jgi:hypothetical protein